MDKKTSDLPLPSVRNYKLSYKIFPKEGRLLAETDLEVANYTEKTFIKIPLLLYRLLKVKSIFDGDGEKLKFEQSVTELQGEESMRVNLIWLKLSKPLEPNTSAIIKVAYKGRILGYQDVWDYVKDKVDEDFSLLRPDSLAYPIISTPVIQSLYSFHRNADFTYELRVDVPKGYIAACGGELTETREMDGRSTFFIRNRKPTWRIDIAISRFAILRDKESKIEIYVLEEHKESAERLLREATRVLNFYSESFGRLESFRKYKIIEIPDGWGSQAGDNYNLQTSTTFTDPKDVSKLYHELAHIWNVKPKDEVQRCRWFDEGFASYFEGLAIREFQGQTAFEEYMDKRRESFIENAKDDRLCVIVPIVDYGKHEIGRNSYSKGAWTLYILNLIIGDKAFKKAIRNFLKEFRNKPADFGDFKRTVEHTTNQNLDKFFEEWIYGTESSELLFQRTSTDEIISRYVRNN